MKLAFTLRDVKEISGTAYYAFISTFQYQSENSDSDNSDFDNLDSDLSDFDPEIFGCGEIIPEVEDLIENTWEICNRLDDVYGTTTSKIIKETVLTAIEETQCVGL